MTEMFRSLGVDAGQRRLDHDIIGGLEEVDGRRTEDPEGRAGLAHGFVKQPVHGGTERPQVAEGVKTYKAGHGSTSCRDVVIP